MDHCLKPDETTNAGLRKCGCMFSYFKMRNKQNCVLDPVQMARKQSFQGMSH